MHKLRTYSLNILKRTLATKEADVLFETLNNAGIIILNRPKALNSINTSMIHMLLAQLQQMENSNHLVIIKGAGGKAFSSGGDVKNILHNEDVLNLTQVAYNMFHLISQYKIPYVAFLNGVTFGAGLGISVTGRYRLITEKSIVAMPVTKIGLFPGDAGSYFLSRLKNNFGIYLGLTGDRLIGMDIVKVGLGTHFTSSVRLSELENLLSRCTNELEVQSLLNKFDESPAESSVIPHIDHIQYCFAAPTVEEIIERLETVQNDWSIKTLETLQQMCPGSLKIALRSLHRGAQLELRQCLKMEYRILAQALENHDVFEGIRAFIIDKDNKPKWKPKTIAEVDDEYVDSHFQKLSPATELKLFDDLT